MEPVVIKFSSISSFKSLLVIDWKINYYFLSLYSAKIYWNQNGDRELLNTIRRFLLP